MTNVFRVDARLNLQPRYNVCPTDSMPVVRLREGARELAVLRWGLVPSWAKDVKIGARYINARAETVATAGPFRAAYARRRCIVPADGFYEWRKLDAKTKQPYHICHVDNAMLAFAGLWERWRSPGGDVESYTIITTEPNIVMAELHNRMPVILDASDFDQWLDLDADGLELLKPCPDDWLEVYPVSAYVSKGGNEGAECLERVAT